MVLERRNLDLDYKKNKIISYAAIVEDTESIIQEPNTLCILSLSDIYSGRRFEMANIGLDIGTKNIILSVRNGDKLLYIKEINGYFVYPRATKFVRNLLDDPKKTRADGTKRPARYIEFQDRPGLYVLGCDAEELAYSHNDTLLRPMAEGGISKDEDAMMVLASIVQGLLETAEKEIGHFKDKVSLCYCTTARAINKSSNVPYHKEVVDLIIQGYESKAVIAVSSIAESHAIVLGESSKSGGDGTGIGISWGAGTVTVSYVKWGDSVYDFCWVGAGDWIDTEVAMRHGYDPTSRQKSKETPTTICRIKETVDLTPGKEPTGRIELDILLHYKILISNVMNGIVQGFKDNEDKARISDGIDIIMAGGTSMPKGFCERVLSIVSDLKLPFKVNNVKTCEEPLFAVSEGCLIAAEMS